MLKLGTGELVLILIVALVIFGPSRLPALGKMAGKAIGTLRHYANTDNWAELGEDDEDEDEKPKKKKKKAAARKQSAEQDSQPEEASDAGDSAQEEPENEEGAQEEEDT